MELLKVKRSALTVDHKANPAIVSEASSLGLKAGQWPNRVAITDDNDGIILTFYRKHSIGNHGEFAGMVYVNKMTGSHWHILND